MQITVGLGEWCWGKLKNEYTFYNLNMYNQKIPGACSVNMKRDIKSSDLIFWWNSVHFISIYFARESVICWKLFKLAKGFVMCWHPHQNYHNFIVVMMTISSHMEFIQSCHSLSHDFISLYKLFTILFGLKFLVIACEEQLWNLWIRFELAKVITIVIVTVY